jgi:hypothetical protein
MVKDPESSEDVPTHPSPNIVPDFAYHNGNEVLQCPGEKWHHVPMVLVMMKNWPHLILQESAEI